MKRGGKRENAGRKKGVGNLLTEELRDHINALDLIKFLQDLALGKKSKATLRERREAATVLLKKVLPDCQTVRANLNLNSREPLIIVDAGKDPYKNGKLEKLISAGFQKTRIKVMRRPLQQYTEQSQVLRTLVTILLITQIVLKSA